MKDIEKLAFYGALAGLVLFGVYLARNGVGGTARDLTRGFVSGVFDGAGGAIAGAYEAIPEAVKPSSDQNIIYQGANKVVQALPGSSKDETLGTWVYGLFHPNQ